MSQAQSRQALHSSRTYEWYTPSEYVDAARQVLGGTIDLDPASCDLANQFVRAERYYTKEDSGLVKDWNGRVWLNPPYMRGGQETWSKKFLEEYRKGNMTEGILLVNAVPDCKWFQKLWAHPICFASRRIKFIDAEGNRKGSPTHGSVFCYTGDRPEVFVEHFAKFGHIVHP